MNVAAKIKSLFEIDLRSLGCFRIAVGAVVLVDLVWRAKDLDALYGARGVLAPDVAAMLWDWRTVYSPFMLISHSPVLLWIGFGVIATASLCLLLGLAPRLAAAVIWVLLAGLQDRNPPLYMVGDRYLLLLVMWCVLLPTGARFSLRPAAVGVTRLRSWAAVGLLLQIAFANSMTGLKKTGPEWFDGTAIWYALNLPDNVTAVGEWLVRESVLTVPMSYVAKWGEVLAPLLVFSPWKNWVCRLMAVAYFWAFHLGLEMTMQIGIFQMVGMTAWSVFLPKEVWQWLGRRAAIAKEAMIQNQSWSEMVAWGPLSYVALQFVLVLTGLVLRGAPFPVPKLVDKVAVALHVQEGWAMYMRVPRVQRWVVVPGRLADGTTIDALRGSLLQWTKPEEFQSAQGGFRWTHFLNNATLMATFEPRLASTHQSFLSYLCRRWNERHDGKEKLEHVELSIVNIVTPKPGETLEPAHVERNIANRDCAP